MSVEGNLIVKKLEMTFSRLWTTFKPYNWKSLWR